MPARRSLALMLAGAALLGSLASASSAPAAPPCAPTPTYDDSITPPSQAIPGFPNRRATTDELNAYVELVDAESDRVSGGVFARSWGGKDLRYALVSHAANASRTASIASAQQRLRDPRRTTNAEAARIARGTPAIVWYTAVVHGDEPSGGDAAVHILYELAARTDCQVRGMLDNLLVGIIPTQNPDGRDEFERTNAYMFDMNRDWFARTQPETDGKLRLLSRYPPVLFIDAHEQGPRNFFFPPNADPIHHEISPQSIHWINDLYGPAMAAAFDRRRQSDPLNWDYFNYDIYDLFYMGYGDTVPTTAFTAAGMTFEKGLADTDRQKELEQFVAGWTSLRTASSHKDAILNDYYRAHVAALAEGRAGSLEPNRVYQPGNKVLRRVPPLRVRHYFLDGERRFPDVARLVDRLLRMGVEVYRLSQDLRVPDLRRYGRAAIAGTIRAGSYWIPMEQPQKRWVQAMLAEDTYVPFPYFYDVTAWSNPLLMNLDAAFSGARLSPMGTRLAVAPGGWVRGNAGRATFFSFPGDTGASVAAGLSLARSGLRVVRLDRPALVPGANLPAGTFVVPSTGEAASAVTDAAARFRVRVDARQGRPPPGQALRNPKIALYAPLTAQAALGEESLGHLRFLLDHVWEIPYTPLTGLEVTAGALTLGGYDVFLVPGVSTFDLAAAGPQIGSWIEHGGVYVGTARPGDTGGTPYAVDQGFTSSSLRGTQGLQVPGSLFRVSLAPGSPLTLGADLFSYWFHLGEGVLAPSSTGANAGTYPKQAPDFWYSGYAGGQDVLEGSAALVDERLGNGHAVLFSGEPNYRAFTEGSAFLLANAIAYPARGVIGGIDVGSPAAATAVGAAMASGHPAFGPGRPIRIEVDANGLSGALDVAHRFARSVWVERLGSSAILVIPNPRGLDAGRHPFAARLLPALRAAGIEVRSAIL